MDLLEILAEATTDTILYVRYSAGRAPSDQAREEFHAGRDWKHLQSNEFICHFKELRRNRRGELNLVVFAHNRGALGETRVFNPNLGTMHEVKVIAL